MAREYIVEWNDHYWIMNHATKPINIHFWIYYMYRDIKATRWNIIGKGIGIFVFSEIISDFRLTKSRRPRRRVVQRVRGVTVRDHRWPRPQVRCHLLVRDITTTKYCLLGLRVRYRQSFRTRRLETRNSVRKRESLEKTCRSRTCNPIPFYSRCQSAWNEACCRSKTSGR